MESSIKHRDYYYRFSWFQLFRPMTFSGTMSPIIVGTGVAALHGPIRYDLFIALLLAALLVQISANIFNDYFDFKHGQDYEKWAEDGSFKNPLHHYLPYAAAVSIGLAVIIGAWISSEVNWGIALVGSIGILAGLGYSAGKHSFSALGLGEVVAAIFLGFLTTILGFIVQGHVVNTDILLTAFTFAILISTMILTNNIRDIKKDVGFRQTVAMRLGKRRAIRVLTSLLGFVYVWSIVLVVSGVLPRTTLLSFGAIAVAVRLRWCFRNDAPRSDEISAMGWAGKHHWTFGLLFAFGVWLGI